MRVKGASSLGGKTSSQATPRYGKSATPTPLQKWMIGLEGSTVTNQKVLKVEAFSNGRGAWLTLEDGSRVSKIMQKA